MQRKIQPPTVLLGVIFLIFAVTAPVLSATIYVGNRGSNSISVIDSLTRQLVKTVPISTHRPHNLALSVDGRYLYVANVGSHNVLMFEHKKLG